MDIGMLWLDDDKNKSLDEKVSLAADYYSQKYGKRPNLCLVNQSMLDNKRQVGKVEVRPVRNVLPNHFWVGISSN